jgi:hypothetical protein
VPDEVPLDDAAPDDDAPDVVPLEVAPLVVPELVAPDVVPELEPAAPELEAPELDAVAPESAELFMVDGLLLLLQPTIEDVAANAPTAVAVTMVIQTAFIVVSFSSSRRPSRPRDAPAVCEMRWC